MQLFRIPRAWQLPDRDATDETVYLGRREFLRTAAAGVAILSAGGLKAEDTKAGPYPAPRNDKYKLDRPLTDETVASRYNIFDEFSFDRDKVWQVAKGFVTTPWAIHIGGTVKKEKKIDVDDLIRQFGIEERLYRHRCVEAWAMAVPWSGFALKKLVDFAEPLSTAKYLRMVSYGNPEKLPGWYGSRRVFPYYEALTLAEATNELAFLATGIYGHALPPQHGAPIRLVVPWKYGFKSIKSIVSFQFTAEKPGTFWNELSPAKYTFESNVEPAVARPWPQDMETILGTEEKRKSVIYNGYGDFVASLYR